MLKKRNNPVRLTDLVEYNFFFVNRTNFSIHFLELCKNWPEISVKFTEKISTVIKLVNTIDYFI